MFIKVHFPFMPGVRLQSADLGLCMGRTKWDYFEGIHFKRDFIYLLISFFFLVNYTLFLIHL